MADNLKYLEREILNKVLNSGEDALKVDIDNVTLKTEGSDINIEVHLDKAEDSVVMFCHTVKTGAGGTSYVPIVDSDGHLQVDLLSSGLPSGCPAILTLLKPILFNTPVENISNVESNFPILSFTLPPIAKISFTPTSFKLSKVSFNKFSSVIDLAGI